MRGTVWTVSAKAGLRVLGFCSVVSQDVGREILRDMLKVRRLWARGRTD